MATDLLDDRLAVGLSESARLLGLGLSTVKALAARGDLRTLRIGRRRLVPMQELRAYLERVATEEAAE